MPSIPVARSTRITVVASVFDPAAGAVSAMRTTSPPMLLGRKLLKNMLTQIDSVSVRRSTSMCCARNKRFHRHTRDRLRERVRRECEQNPRGIHALHALPERWEIDRAQHEVQQCRADAEAYEYLQQQKVSLIVETPIVT